MGNYLIETKRLGMRTIQEKDRAYLQTLDRDPDVKKFFPSGPLSDEELQEIIYKCIHNCENKNLPCFVIFKLKTKAFVGRAYFDLLEGEVKIGYLFHKKYWNKGFATEVLQAMLSWAKEHLKTDYVIAYADKNHSASFRVMKKCGMRYYKKGVFKGMESKFYRYFLR